MEREKGETSKGQARSSLEDKTDNIFGSLNFDPQLFVNDVRNAVDDVLDEGFGFFKEQAPNVLGLKDDAVVDKLSKAIDTIQYTVQLKLDKQLDTWERYCIMHCFDIPKGLSFPEMNYPYNSPLESSREDESSDMDLDSRLESLRESLVAAGRKSAELRGELSILERQAAVNARRAEVLDDALQPLEENTTHDFTTEFIRATSVLREKLEHWKTERRDKMENLRIERIRSPNIYNIKRKYFPGFEANVDDMQQFVNNFKGIYQS
ncbi:protein MIS12 homolog isoform X1 [Cryptomeria japonica]|uniref:protein MIS12 homolog isoform X1 n=1 Tax=Cryptomeria japonica TaxID=3369 RepID=UPI0025AB8AA9|nr:protein MIS12 homolog isoform X1 [Cryptomeria japonica]